MLCGTAQWYCLGSPVVLYMSKTQEYHVILIYSSGVVLWFPDFVQKIYKKIYKNIMWYCCVVSLSGTAPCTSCGIKNKISKREYPVLLLCGIYVWYCGTRIWNFCVVLQCRTHV